MKQNHVLIEKKKKVPPDVNIEKNKLLKKPWEFPEIGMGVMLGEQLKLRLRKIQVQSWTLLFTLLSLACAVLMSSGTVEILSVYVLHGFFCTIPVLYSNTCGVYILIHYSTENKNIQ